MGYAAFGGCSNLSSVAVSACHVDMETLLFHGCASLESVRIAAALRTDGSSVYSGCPESLTTRVSRCSGGWEALVGKGTWQDRPVTWLEAEDPLAGVVVEGFPDVLVPEAWFDSFQDFRNQYGTNYAEAVLMPTGKRDAAGNPLLVWHDFVAGTDPTDPESVFTASLSFVDGRPVLTWTPDLNADAERRRYTVFGKKSLVDAEWTVVGEGDLTDYNYFKVSVGLR